MSVLTVTAEGQVTLQKEFLEHLGVQPGEKVLVDKLPDGQVTFRAARKGDISRVFGIVKQENGPHLTIEEMNEIIAGAWAGER